jgi:hypothetical protein
MLEKHIVPYFEKVIAIVGCWIVAFKFDWVGVHVGRSWDLDHSWDLDQVQLHCYCNFSSSSRSNHPAKIQRPWSTGHDLSNLVAADLLRDD